MSPNDVKELLDAFIAELGFPLYASDRGPQLVVDTAWNGLIESKVEEVLDGWNECPKRYSISVGQSVSNMEKAITLLSLETYRVPEIQEVLKSLIRDCSLPLNVADRGFRLEVLADKDVDYSCDYMLELEALLAAEGLDIEVRHSGFELRQAENSSAIGLPKFEALANRLASALETHGLQVGLLHQGFELQKHAEDEVDIAEAKELTYRLEIMVGIRYVQGNYSYSNDVQNPEVHWKSAGVNTALPIL